MKAECLFLTLLLGGLLDVPARANDAIYYASGSHLVPLEETTIRVEREVLDIALHDDGYAVVNVSYEFHNDSVARTLLMGFEADPPQNTFDPPSPDGNPYMEAFTVEMNGQPVGWHSAVCLLGDDGRPAPVDTARWRYDPDMGLGDAYVDRRDSNNVATFVYVYSFEAAFRPGKNVVRHSYRYKMSEAVFTPFIVPYRLTPAARWAGHRIGDFTLRLRCGHTPRSFLIEGDDFREAPFRVVSGTAAVRQVRDGDGTATEVTALRGILEWHKAPFTPTDELVLVSVGE